MQVQFGLVGLLRFRLGRIKFLLRSIGCQYLYGLLSRVSAQGVIVGRKIRVLSSRKNKADRPMLVGCGRDWSHEGARKINSEIFR